MHPVTPMVRPLERPNGDADGGGGDSGGDGVEHCHRLTRPQRDVTARNQLIATSVLCAVFMGVEILGEHSAARLREM